MSAPIMDQFLCDKECDAIAEIWVKGGNNLHQWRSDVGIIADMVDRGERDNYSASSRCAEFWDGVDGDGEGLLRCSKNIEGWIVSHMAAYGRIKFQRKTS